MDLNKYVLSKLLDIEKRLAKMEFANQVNKIILGTGANKITLDANTGQISIGDSNFVIDGVNQKITVSKSGSPIDLIDGYGLISNSPMTATASSVTEGLSQQIVGGSPGTVTDITGMTFTLNPFRTVKVWVFAQVTGWIYNAGAGDYFGDGIVYIYKDGSEVTRTVECGGISAGEHVDSFRFFSNFLHAFLTLPAGSHTINLRGSCDIGTGSPGLCVYDVRLSYLQIGN